MLDAIDSVDVLALTAVVHAAATGIMAGLIWFVQIVHYPLMARVGEGAFVGYEQAHTIRTTWVVGPTMFVEAGTSVLLLVLAPGPATIAGVAMLAGVWLSTFAIQVPLHGKLSRGWDGGAHARLVRTNWVRTVLWSGRFVVALWLVAGHASA